MSKINTVIVPECTVTLFNETNSYDGVTDEQGTLRFDNVPDGKYTLLVTKQGYEDYKYPEPIIVNDRNIDVVASCPLKISQDEIDESVASLTINFILNPVVKGASIKLVGDNTYSIKTNEDGKAVLENVAYGSYKLTCDAEGYDEYSTSILVNKSNNDPRTLNIELSVTE